MNLIPPVGGICICWTVYSLYVNRIIYKKKEVFHLVFLLKKITFVAYFIRSGITGFCAMNVADNLLICSMQRLYFLLVYREWSSGNIGRCFENGVMVNDVRRFRRVVCICSLS